MRNLLTFFVGVLFLITSCKKKEGIQTISVSMSIKNKIPYRSGQYLQFIGGNGDTLSVIVSLKTEVTLEPDCLSCSVSGPVKAESIYYTLIHTRDTIAEIFSQARFGNYLNFNVGYPRRYNGLWNSMSTSILVEENSTDFNCSSNTYRECLDTITVGSTKYVKAIRFKNSNIITSNPIVNFIYSKEKGLIQFEYLNGYKYSLLN